LSNLSARVDTLVIGGGMANTFFAAQGHSVGTSLCEDAMLDTARAIMAEAEKQGCAILLPRDVVHWPRICRRTRREIVSSMPCLMIK
jgi:phosphoglycerate kinase